MQDIVVKRVDTPSDSAAHSHHSQRATPDSIKSGSFLRNALNILNLVGGWFQKRMTDYTPEVITPARNPDIQARHTEKRSTKERLKGKARHLAHRAREKGRSAKRALKTPIGKVALVHSTALVALFALVLSQNPQLLQNTERAVLNGVQGGIIRQYLPKAQDIVIPQKFEEKELVAEKSRTVSLSTWVTPWNIGEVASQVNAYRSVSAFWLTLGDDGFTLVPKGDWNIWNQFREIANDSSQRKFVTITADPDHSYLALTSSTIQEKQIANLLQIVREQQFDGVDIDFEALGEENRDLFTNFVRNLSNAFHAENKLVAVTLEARIANQVPMDWRNVGLIADEVRIMAYDYHSRTTGFPGPIAPLAWVKEVADYAISIIPAEKIIMGLGNYGYDWKQDVDEAGTVSWQGTGLSFDEAVSLAKEKKSPIIQGVGIDERGYDIGQAPTFSYRDNEGIQHAVWFEDKTSLQKKVDLLSQYQLGGIIFWSVGLGDSSFWQHLTGQ